MKKKLLAAILTVAQLASLSFFTMSANADTVDSYEWDFEGYTENSNYDIMQIRGTVSENDKITPEVITESYGTSAKLISTNDNMLFDANFANVQELGEPYAVSISYDMYTGDYNGNKALDLRINGTATNYTNMIMVSTAGNLKLMNSIWYGSANLVPQNDWRNFEVKLYYGTNKAEIYLVGTKIKDLTLEETINTVNGFRFVNYNSASSNLTSGGTAVMGLDNVKIKIYNKYDSETAVLDKDFTDGIGNVSSSGGSVAAVGGIGYKAESDKAAYFDAADATSYFRYFTTPTTTTLTSPYTYHLSFEWFVESVAANSALDIYLNGAAKYNFIKFYGNGTTTINTKSAITLDQWHKYDLYFHCGTTNCDVYVDGSKVTTITTDTINYVNGYGFVAQKGMKMAVDNISLTIENTEDSRFAYESDAMPKFFDFSNVSAVTTADAVNADGYSVGNGKMVVKNGVTDGGLFVEEVVTNQFGRDSLYHIGTKAGATYTVNNQYGNEEELSIAHNGTLKAGDIIQFGESIMFTDMSQGINITSYMNSVQRNDNLVLAVAANGTAKAFGETLSGVTFKENTWYKLDYIITVGGTESANTADMYIDGIKVTSTPVSFITARGATENTLLESFKIGNLVKAIGGSVSNVDGVYQITPESEQNIYFDDIYIDVTNNESKIASLKASIASETIKIENGNTVIGISDLKVEDLLNEVTVENGTLKVVDETGAEVKEGYISDNYIVIERNIGGVIFVKTEKVDYDAYMIYNDFDDGKNLTSDFLIPNKQTSRNAAGVALKNADNNAVFFDLEANAVNVLVQNATQREITDDFVLELSLYTPQSDADVHVQFKLNDAATNSYVVFDKNHAIKVLGGEVVGTWKGGRWYKLALVFDSDNGYMDFYINGVLVKKEKKINTDAISKIVETRFTYEPASDIATTCGFDDIKLYQGAYDNSRDYVFVKPKTYSSSSLDRVVFINADVDKETFVSDFNVVGQVNVYDSAMNTTETVTDGCILVVKSLDSDNIDYYDVVDITKNTFVGQIQVMLNSENITECADGTVTAQAVVGTQSQLTVIAALYEGDKLVKTSDGTLSTSGILSTDITIDNAKEQNLKVFVWDSISGMKPYADVHNLGVSLK